MYESYCRNYTTALKLIFTHEENLAVRTFSLLQITCQSSPLETSVICIHPSLLNTIHQPLNHLINAKGELPTFVIKPIQHIGEYSLLLDVSLVATLNPGSGSYCNFARP